MHQARHDPWPELIDQVTAWMDAHDVPRAAVGILCDGHIQTAGFRQTSVENPLAVDERTLLRSAQSPRP